MFNDLIGLPYDDCGRCYGLCRTVSKRLGVELPDWPEVAISQVAQEIEKAKPMFVRVDDYMPGDLVHINNFDSVPHVGIIIAPGVMLQTTAKHGCHKISLEHPWLKGRIEGVYRYVAKRK